MAENWWRWPAGRVLPADYWTKCVNGIVVLSETYSALPTEIKFSWREPKQPDELPVIMEF